MKTLFYDIETEPNLGYTWGKWEQNILSFKEERSLLSYSYKWLGSNKIVCVTKQGNKNDKKLVKSLASLLSKADIVVAHNGDEFDYKIVKTRMLYWGMPALKLASSVDTKKVAKRYFNFNSNSLDDLCKFLKIGRKRPTPGFSMWLGCMSNIQKDWRTLIRYNKHDVLLLECLYKKLRPWIENHPNVALLSKIRDNVCPSCVSKNVIKRGFRATAAMIKQVYMCKSCSKQWLRPIKKHV